MKTFVVIAASAAILVAVVGAMFFRGDPPGADWTFAWVVDRQAMALVFVGSLILLVILGEGWGTVRGRLAPAVCISVGISFLYVLATLSDMRYLWSPGRLLTYAILLMGGLIALAISPEKQSPAKTALESLRADVNRADSAAEALLHPPDSSHK